MKNISLTVSPYTGYAPAPPMPMGQPSLKVAELPKYSVAFSSQFDSEEEALIFAGFLISKLGDFKDHS